MKIINQIDILTNILLPYLHENNKKKYAPKKTILESLPCLPILINSQLISN